DAGLVRHFVCGQLHRRTSPPSKHVMCDDLQLRDHLRGIPVRADGFNLAVFVHFTAAELPATNIESSVNPTLLKFLQIDERNSRIAARPVIPGAPTGS